MNRRLATALTVLFGVAVGLTLAESYGPVRRGQDPWDIARRVYPGEDVSRDQVLLALLEANP